MKDTHPAYPMQYLDDSYQVGMQLRDYFASAALAGIITADADWSLTAEGRAKIAYETADAMMEARNK